MRTVVLKSRFNETNINAVLDSGAGCSVVIDINTGRTIGLFEEITKMKTDLIDASGNL